MRVQGDPEKNTTETTLSQRVILILKCSGGTERYIGRPRADWDVLSKCSTQIALSNFPWENFVRRCCANRSCEEINHVGMPKFPGSGSAMKRTVLLQFHISEGPFLKAHHCFKEIISPHYLHPWNKISPHEIHPWDRITLHGIYAWDGITAHDIVARNLRTESRLN